MIEIHSFYYFYSSDNKILCQTLFWIILCFSRNIKKISENMRWLRYMCIRVCVCDYIVFKKKSTRISSVESMYHKSSMGKLYSARERTRLLPVLHLACLFASVVDSRPASLLPWSFISVSRRPRKIVGSRIIHSRRKLHVSVPHCATSPSGAFSVRFRSRRKRNHKSRPLQMYTRLE